MIYCRVKPEYDQTPRIKYHRKASKRVKEGIFIANELYTPRELDMFDLTYSSFIDMFELVSIPKTRTYWLFGARFERFDEVAV